MFIILPVGMNYRTGRLPVVTLALIAINTLVFLATFIASVNTNHSSDQWALENLWMIPALHQWWTYLTTMFVHAGFLHLLGNMMFLFLFGCCVEDLVGRARFIFMYLIGGLIATLTYILFSPDQFASEIPMGGASGAISACMGMYLVLRASARIEFKYFYFFLWTGAVDGEFDVPAWAAITFWFAKDLFWMIIGNMYHKHGGGVAFGTHVGGLLGGTLLAGLHRLTASKVEEEQPEDGVIESSGDEASPTTSSEAPSIFIFANGRQSGPFTLQQVQAMLRIGHIRTDALYWSQGLSGWHPVTELAG